MSKKKIISIAKYLFFLGLGVFLFWLALGDIKWDEIKESLATANYLYVGLTVVAMLLSHYFRAARWKLLLKASGHEVDIKNTYACVLVGYGFNTLVPRGGEFARCTSLSQSEKVPFAAGFGTVITERLSDVFVLGLLFCTLLILEFEKIGEVWQKLNEVKQGADPKAGMSVTKIIMLSFLAIMALGLIALFIFRKRIGQSNFGKKVGNFGKTLRESMMSIMRLDRPWLFLYQTFMIWFLYLMMSYLPLMALKQTQHLDLYFSFIILIFGGIGFLLPSPGGTGTYHIAVEKTFEVFRNAGSSGFLYALMVHAWQFIVTLIFGVLAWLYLRNKASKAAAETAS